MAGVSRNESKTYCYTSVFLRGGKDTAVPKPSNGTSTIFEDLSRTFEEENLRLRRLVEEQKVFTDQVLEGNKKIRAEVALLRRDLADATRPLQLADIHPGRLLALAKRFAVKSWDEFNAQCDEFGEWLDDLTRDQPIGWMCACGVLGLTVVALVAQMINIDQNYILIERYS